jgi:AraC-like DNA-binding protein
MNRPNVQTFGAARASAVLIAQSIDYADGSHEIAHVHHRAQLVYATGGIVRVVTPFGLWMLTPGQSLLIGSAVEHALHMVGEVSMRTLYIQPEALPELAYECRALKVEALLHASILGMFDPVLDDPEDTRGTLLVPLILRLIRHAFAKASESQLPLPANARLRRVCESLIAEPRNNESLEYWAEQVGASGRTVARLFRQETGMTFGQWREQLRVTDAMSRLAVGADVTAIADELGYTDARTFGAMFRRVTGMTPQQFRLSVARE